MTLLNAVIAYAELLGELPEDLETDATAEQLALDLETSDLLDVYAHFFGRVYILFPMFDGTRLHIADVHRYPDMPDTGPLLARLVEV